MEFTDCIMWMTGEPVVASANFDDPSPLSIEVLEDSLFISFYLKDIKALMNSNSGVREAWTRFMSMGWRINWEHKEAIQRLNYSGRYRWFLNNYPNVIDRMPHYQIASFLNMSPVTMSRIRARMKKEPMK